MKHLTIDAVQSMTKDRDAAGYVKYQDETDPAPSSGDAGSTATVTLKGAGLATAESFKLVNGGETLAVAVSAKSADQWTGTVEIPLTATKGGFALQMIDGAGRVTATTSVFQVT